MSWAEDVSKIGQGGDNLDTSSKTSTRAVLRQRARDAVTASGPPTVPIAIPHYSSGLDLEVERQVLDLALRVGEALIATGAPVADTTAAMHRLASGFGVTACQVDITFVSMTVSIDRDDGPITKVRVINVRTADYSRLADLLTLIDEAGRGVLTVEQARERLDLIVEAPHPYRRWVVTLALAGMAAGVAELSHGSWLTTLVAAGTTMVIDRMLRWLRTRGVPYLFQQIAGAGFATVVAMFLHWVTLEFNWPDNFATPSLVVVAGIVVLLAGLSLVGAAEDAISGYPLTAAARSFEVVTYTVGIVTGVGLVLNVGQRLGSPLNIAEYPSQPAPLLLQAVAGALIAGTWSLASYGRVRTVMVSAGVGLISATLFAVLNGVALGPVGSSFVAALAVGLLSRAVGERLGAPSLAISVCGLTPLLPGLMIYRGMFTLVRQTNLVGGAVMLISALSIGLALAAGVTLGEFVATALGTDSDRWERRVRWRARGART